MSSGRPGGRGHGATSESVHHASQALFWVATVFFFATFFSSLGYLYFNIPAYTQTLPAASRVDQITCSPPR